MHDHTYDSICSAVEFQRKPITWAGCKTYWGYHLPSVLPVDQEQLAQAKKDGTKPMIFCEVGSHWDEEKLWMLQGWLGRIQPSIRRAFTPNGIIKYYAAMSKRGQAGYSVESAESLQLAADQLVNRWDIPTGRSPSRSAEIISHARSSWGLLKMVQSGLVEHPPIATQPEAVRQYLR